jgi:hypothetical protein
MEFMEFIEFIYTAITYVMGPITGNYLYWVLLGIGSQLKARRSESIYPPIPAPRGMHRTRFRKRKKSKIRFLRLPRSLETAQRTLAGYLKTKGKRVIKRRAEKMIDLRDSLSYR